MDFYLFKRRKKRQNKDVAQKDMLQIELHIRIDAELNKDLKYLAEELGQKKSKVARDILTDFFLEKHTKDWQEEVEEW